MNKIEKQELSLDVSPFSLQFFNMAFRVVYSLELGASRLWRWKQRFVYRQWNLSCNSWYFEAWDWMILIWIQDIRNIYDQLRQLEMFSTLYNSPLKAICASARYERHPPQHVLFRLVACYLSSLSSEQGKPENMVSKEKERLGYLSSAYDGFPIKIFESENIRFLGGWNE